MRTPLIALSAIAAVALPILVYIAGDRGIEPLPRKPIEIPITLPFPDLLARELNHIVAEVDTEKILAATTDAAFSSTVGGASTAGEAASELVASDSPPVDSRLLADSLFLEERYSEFAYLGSAGSLSGKRLGTFHTIASGDRKTALEGGTIHMLHIDKIEEDHVVLSHGQAEPVKKPRITLEIDDRPESEISPEERQARETRYKELFGNRHLVEARRHARENGLPEVQAPTPEQEAEARKRYMETYAVFFQKLKAGDPTANPREFPIPDQKFEENVRRYFETNWPNQVEVTTDPGNPSNPSRREN